MAFWSNEYKHYMRDIFPPVAADIIKEKFLAAGFDPAGVSDEHENIIDEIYSWGAYSPMDRFDDKESLDFSNAPAEYRDRLAKSVLKNIDSFDIDEEALTRLLARMEEYVDHNNIIVVVKAVSSWDNGAEFPHNVYFNTETGEVDMSLGQLEEISGQDSSDLYSFDIVIKNGGMTAVYNLSEDGDRFRAQEKDLNTIRSHLSLGATASDVQKVEIPAIAKATEMTILAHDIKIDTAVENLAKEYAIRTYTSDGEDYEDYDRFMVSDCLEKTRLSIWEPFENYSFEEMQDLVESEFDSALNFAKKAIAIQEKTLNVDADVMNGGEEEFITGRYYELDDVISEVEGFIEDINKDVFPSQDFSLKDLAGKNAVMTFYVTHVVKGNLSRDIEVNLYDYKSNSFKNITDVVADELGLAVKNGGVRVQGAGMDMTFALAESIKKHVLKNFGELVEIESKAFAPKEKDMYLSYMAGFDDKQTGYYTKGYYDEKKAWVKDSYEEANLQVDERPFAGQSDFRVGTKIRIRGIDGEDSDLNGLTGELTHPFAFGATDKNWVGVYLDKAGVRSGNKCNIKVSEIETWANYFDSVKLLKVDVDADVAAMTDEERESAVKGLAEDADKSRDLV